MESFRFDLIVLLCFSESLVCILNLCQTDWDWWLWDTPL